MRFARPFFRQDAIWVEPLKRFLTSIGYRRLKALSMETANPHLFAITCGADTLVRQKQIAFTKHRRGQVLVRHSASAGMLRESLRRRGPNPAQHLVDGIPPNSQNLRRPRLVALDPAQNAQQVPLLQLLQWHKFFIIGSDALVGSAEDFR